MGQQAQRWVIHADLDAFFAAVAVLLNPELAGKPVIVGGSPTGRGVVASASYEARAFGVRSAMPAAHAVRLCPQATFVRVPGDAIRQYAGRFREILSDFSPVVEVVSVDEAYLDASHSERLFGGPVRLARQLKARVREETDLTVSLGVASNRLVAKIASDLRKPNGFMVVRPGAEAATLAPLPIEALPGIGPRTSVWLHTAGITTLGQLARVPERQLRAIAGRHAVSLRRRARGECDRPVLSERAPRKSLGHERTFGRDLYGLRELEVPLFGLAERTGAALRREGLSGSVVALKLRYADFETISRQISLPEPTDAHQMIFASARKLLAAALTMRDDPVRLIGVRVSGLLPASYQRSLFNEPRDRQQQLNQALDRLMEQYGQALFRPASIGFGEPRSTPWNGLTVNAPGGVDTRSRTRKEECP